MIDPELAATEDDTAAFVAVLSEMMASAPAFHDGTPEEARQGLPGLPEPPVLDHGETRVIQGPGGDLQLRIFAPEHPVGVYFHIHGGGWVIGSAFTTDTKFDQIANAASVVVVSVDYRLAPEHPYPAANDDCEAAARWVLDNAEAEWGVTDMVIGGESAGGHLTAVTALRLKQSGDIDRVKGLNLVYGVFDLSMTPSQVHGTELLLIPTATMQWFYDHYLQADEDRTAPDVSPLYADLAGMPPALFTVGTADPLLDDTLFMHRRYQAAGIECSLDVFPAAPHAFTAIPNPAGEVANNRANDFIASCFA